MSELKFGGSGLGQMGGLFIRAAELWGFFNPRGWVWFWLRNHFHVLIFYLQTQQYLSDVQCLIKKKKTVCVCTYVRGWMSFILKINYCFIPTHFLKQSRICKTVGRKMTLEICANGGGYFIWNLNFLFICIIFSLKNN